MTTRTKEKTEEVDFWSDRYPDLTVATRDGEVQFRDGRATAVGDVQIEAVRSVSASHGIQEGVKPDDAPDHVQAREIAEPIPEQVVGSRPLAFTPDDVPRAPESFSEDNTDQEPSAAMLQGTVPAGDRPTETKHVKGSPENPRRDEPSAGSPKAGKPGRPPKNK